MPGSVATLLAAHAALPEAYQPAWGLKASRSLARRACDDRLAVILPLLGSLPADGPVRILDVGCAQGYFTLAIAHALAGLGRECEVVGVDHLAANVDFCRALAAHHGIAARFFNERFDAAFFTRHDDECWDVVLALNVLHHMQRPDDDVAAVVAAARQHARVMVCELAQRAEALAWVGQWPAADAQLLGAFAFRRRVASFPTHLTDVPRPLYVCSDALAWIGERWFAFDHTADRSHAGVPDAFAGQRRFLFGAASVVKAYCGEGDHGAFNRAELNAEASALAILSDEPDRYPAVLGSADDGDTVWLARGLLRGRLLSACIDAGGHVDRTAVARGLLGELAHLESRGFHHGDLRCWNVLVDKDCVRLIDFGALVRKSSPLHRVALAAVLLEIAEGNLSYAQPFYASLHPLSAYPAAWAGLVRYLLETPQRTFRFASALQALDTGALRRGQARGVVQLAPCVDVLVAVAHEQVDGFRRLQEHLADLERRVVVASKESTDAATERAALESARSAAEAHAISLAKSLSESRRYADSLDARLTRETADAEAQRQALKSSADEARSHAASLARALDESRAFASSLQSRIARETAEASAEREALRKAQATASAYSDSLKAALDESKRFVAALQGQIVRETADAKAAREAMLAAQRQSAEHAATLEQQLGESQAYADSLKQALGESQTYTGSLKQALGESHTYANSLRQALGESRASADSLREALSESRLYIETMHARREREAADANRERTRLMAAIAGWQARHARMQRRFRLLKFLWPREPEDPKGAE